MWAYRVTRSSWMRTIMKWYALISIPVFGLYIAIDSSWPLGVRLLLQPPVAPSRAHEAAPSWIGVVVSIWMAIGVLVVCVRAELTSSRVLAFAPEEAKERPLSPDSGLPLLATQAETPVWTGSIRFSERSFGMLSKFLHRRAERLDECVWRILMTGSGPLAAPDGCGVWFDDETGVSLVLTPNGVLTWAEERDLRPDLDRYLRKLEQRRRRLRRFHIPVRSVSS